MKELIEYIPILLIVLTAIIEILMRITPTAKAIGFIEYLIKIINYIIPQKIKKG